MITVYYCSTVPNPRNIYNFTLWNMIDEFFFQLANVVYDFFSVSVGFFFVGFIFWSAEDSVFFVGFQMIYNWVTKLPSIFYVLDGGEEK